MALDHFVSQVHLRRFVDQTTDRLNAIRKSDLKEFSPRTQDVCRIEEGNSNSYLTESRAIESFLKTVEGPYNSAVDRFVEGRPDATSIHALAGFLGYVLTCSPAAMRIGSEPLKAFLHSEVNLLEKLGELPPSPPALGSKNLSELLDDGIVHFKIDPKYPQAIGTTNILHRLVIFGNSRWELLFNNHADCPFFTSDFPVAIEKTRDPRVLGRLFPLTPGVAARVTPDIEVERRGADLSFKHFSLARRTLTRQQAILINRLLVQSAEDIVFFSSRQSWIRRFIEKNRYFRIEPETVRIADGTGHFLWTQQSIKTRTESA